MLPGVRPHPDEGNEFEGGRYPMVVHGILHTTPWEYAGQSTQDGAAVTVTVTDNEESRKSYPYGFRVTVTYTLKGSVLRFDQKYENTGDKAMPFSFGFHPYFSISAVDNLVWDLTAESVRDAATGELTPSPAWTSPMIRTRPPSLRRREEPHVLHRQGQRPPRDRPL